MKPAVILFTTISFVMILTLLIMRMINTNEDILVENEKEYIDANALLVVHDLKQLIGEKLLENKSTIDDFIISTSDSSLQYKDIQVHFSLEEFYRPYNLNNILQNTDLEDIKKYFRENGFDFEEFSFFIQEYFSSYDIDKISLENNKQIKDILLSFQKYSQDQNIDSLFHNFTYFDMDHNDKYYSCGLLIQIDKYRYKSSFIYDLNTLDKNNIKVLDFEITIAS